MEEGLWSCRRRKGSSPLGSTKKKRAPAKGALTTERNCMEATTSPTVQSTKEPNPDGGFVDIPVPCWSPPLVSPADLLASTKSVAVTDKASAEAVVHLIRDVRGLELEFCTRADPVLRAGRVQWERLQEAHSSVIKAFQEADKTLRQKIAVWMKKTGGVVDGVRKGKSTWKVTILDRTLIPAEFWIIDEDALKKKAEALRMEGNAAIPGVQVEEIPSAAVLAVTPGTTGEGT